jgi:hypothetical protein
LPWQNAYVESFGGRVRDELLSVELFSCLAEAQVLIKDWREDYNHHRPHSSLGMMTPIAFAASLRQPQRGPTATAAGEGIEQRRLQTSAGSEPQPASSRPGKRQNPAEEITSATSRTNSHTTTTPTQLSRQVDR